MTDWESLAARLGPQSAAYLFPDEWAGKLRTIACRCGALIEIFDEDAPPADAYRCGALIEIFDEDAPPADAYRCDACTLRDAFAMDDHAATFRVAQGDQR